MVKKMEFRSQTIGNAEAFCAKLLDGSSRHLREEQNVPVLETHDGELKEYAIDDAMLVEEAELMRK
jgi:hypothetical protein